MKQLTIIWQRLVDKEGTTCSRCGSTQLQLHDAVKKLEESLKPLGIEVVLEEKELDASTCACDVTESNRIWVAGKPLEEWVDAHIGKSPCPCDICHNAECRTVEVTGTVYEVLPAEIIIKAALIAAAEIILPSSEEPCCAGTKPKATIKNCCD